MKNALFIFILTVFANFKLQAITPQIHHIDSILIHYVDFDLMTTIGINCNSFESTLPYEKVILRDSIYITEFKKMLLKDKYTTEYPVDVRCKIYMFTPKGVEVTCIGNHSLQYRDSLYEINHLFIDKIKEFISKGEEVLNDTIIQHSPPLLMEKSLFYDSIRQRCLPFMKKEKIDTLKILIDFYIDRQGNAIDITVKGWRNQSIPITLQNEIIALFQEKFKWFPSESRPYKIKQILPLTLIGE